MMLKSMTEWFLDKENILAIEIAGSNTPSYFTVEYFLLK